MKELLTNADKAKRLGVVAGAGMLVHEIELPPDQGWVKLLTIGVLALGELMSSRWASVQVEKARLAGAAGAAKAKEGDVVGHLKDAIAKERAAEGAAQ